MKIAIYDFCDTIVNFQTADEYVYFTQKYLGLTRFSNTYMKSRYIQKFFEKNWKRNKAAILYQLRGITKDSLINAAEMYYQKRIRPNLYQPVLDGIRNNQRDGYEVYLVSAGYRIYLDYFAREFNINGVISNEFRYKADRFTGKLVEDDCYGEEKVSRVERVFKGRKVEDSVSYSDSISDLPILRWAKKGVVVSRNSHRSWISENGFEDFVLSDQGIYFDQ